jgi:hypothetical protein
MHEQYEPAGAPCSGAKPVAQRERLSTGHKGALAFWATVSLWPREEPSGKSSGERWAEPGDEGEE